MKIKDITKQDKRKRKRKRPMVEISAPEIERYKEVLGPNFPLFKRYYLSQGEEKIKARNEIIMFNLGLGRTTLNLRKAQIEIALKDPKIEWSDLFQQTIFGLIRAIELYDPRKGYTFSTYATWWINQAIRRYIEESSGIVRVPSPRQGELNKLKQAIAELQKEKETEQVPIEEIAERMDIPLEKTYELMNNLHFLSDSLSLDAPVSEDATKTTPFLDIVSSPEQLLAAEQETEQQELKEVVGLLLEKLKPRERLCLKKRYGLDGTGSHTLQEIGKELGVSRERVRQITKEAMEKLQHPRNIHLLRKYLGMSDEDEQPIIQPRVKLWEGQTLPSDPPK